MFNVGPEKLMVVLFIALIVLGPDKLPNAARQIGRYLNEFRRISQGFQQELRSAMDVTDLGSAAGSSVAGGSAVADGTAATGASPTAAAASDEPSEGPTVSIPTNGAPEPTAGASDPSVPPGANTPQEAGAAPPTIPSVSGQLDSNRAPQA